MYHSQLSRGELDSYMSVRDEDFFLNVDRVLCEFIIEHYFRYFLGSLAERHNTLAAVCRSAVNEHELNLHARMCSMINI